MENIKDLIKSLKSKDNGWKEEITREYKASMMNEPTVYHKYSYNGEKVFTIFGNAKAFTKNRPYNGLFVKSYIDRHSLNKYVLNCIKNSTQIESRNFVKE